MAEQLDGAGLTSTKELAAGLTSTKELAAGLTSTKELAEEAARRYAPPDPDPELTVQQIAAYLNCPASRIYYWRLYDIGPRTYRSGKRVYARKSDLDAWRRDHEAATTRGGVRVATG